MGLSWSSECSRGPFSCTKDWIDACIALPRNDDQQLLDKYPEREDVDIDAEDKIKATEEIFKMTKGLESIFHIVFPTETDTIEPSVICHDYLSQHNILLDDNRDNGRYIGLGLRVRYAIMEDLLLSHILTRSTTSYEAKYRGARRGDPAPETAYWEHLDGYEKTILLDVFIEDIRR